MKNKGTRQRLNWGFLQGSLLLACLIGVVADSCLAFVIALAVSLLGNVLAGELRFSKRRP